MEYLAFTFGWIVGEIAHRADGRPIAQIIREEICKPLGIEDMYIGFPAEAEPRVTTLEEPAFVMPGETTLPQPIPNCILPLHAWVNRRDVHQACIPASNGIMTAHSIEKPKYLMQLHLGSY